MQTKSFVNASNALIVVVAALLLASCGGTEATEEAVEATTPVQVAAQLPAADTPESAAMPGTATTAPAPPKATLSVEEAVQATIAADATSKAIAAFTPTPVPTATPTPMSEAMRAAEIERALARATLVAELPVQAVTAQESSREFSCKHWIVSPDNALYAALACSESSPVNVWRTSDGSKLLLPEVEAGIWTNMAFSPDSRYLIVQEPGLALQIVNLATGTLEDNEELVTLFRNLPYQIKRAGSFPGSDREERPTMWSPDGRYVARRESSTDNDQGAILIVVDTTTDQVVVSQETSPYGSSERVYFDPTSRFVAIWNPSQKYGEDWRTIHRLADGQKIYGDGDGYNDIPLAFSPVSPLLALRPETGDSPVIVINTEDATTRPMPAVPQTEVFDLVFHSTQDILYVVQQTPNNINQQQLTIVDTRDGSLIAEFPNLGQEVLVADGGALAVFREPGYNGSSQVKFMPLSSLLPAGE
jgi:hypothetical protein